MQLTKAHVEHPWAPRGTQRGRYVNCDCTGLSSLLSSATSTEYWIRAGESRSIRRRTRMSHVIPGFNGKSSWKVEVFNVPAALAERLTTYVLRTVAAMVKRVLIVPEVTLWRHKSAGRLPAAPMHKRPFMLRTSLCREPSPSGDIALSSL